MDKRQTDLVFRLVTKFLFREGDQDLMKFLRPLLRTIVLCDSGLIAAAELGVFSLDWVIRAPEEDGRCAQRHRCSLYISNGSPRPQGSVAPDDHLALVKALRKMYWPYSNALVNVQHRPMENQDLDLWLRSLRGREIDLAEMLVDQKVYHYHHAGVDVKLALPVGLFAA